MKIDQFPTEILMQIFSYLPSYRDVSLVNSQFYSVASRIHVPPICLVPCSKLGKSKKSDKSDCHSNDNEKLQSILNTTRNITEVYIDFEKEDIPTDSLHAIIKKFSTSIAFLSLCGRLEVSDFIEILSLIPNVVHLNLVYVECIESDPSPAIAKGDDLNLHHLKKLEVYKCSDAIIRQFNRLPAKVLRTLTLWNQNMDELNDLFKMQTKVKKLAVQWSRPSNFNNANLFDGLQLEYLQWDSSSFDNRVFQEMLSKQTKLKSLDVIYFGDDDDDDDDDDEEDPLNIITHLTELQCLSILSHPKSFDSSKIKKLKMLKELTFLELTDVKPLETLTTTNHSRIATLDIHLPVSMTSKDLIASLAVSVKNLKVLRILCDRNIETVHAIMKNFNFVEVLELRTYNGNSSADTARALSEGSCANKLLKELKIDYDLPYSTEFLDKLIKDYPNLNKLLLRSKSALTVEQFQMVLNGFSKLESLTFRQGTSKLRVEDLYALRKHSNLKYIALEDLKIEFTSEVKKNLQKIFDYVSFSSNKDLKMAVGRKIMENEMQYFSSR